MFACDPPAFTQGTRCDALLTTFSCHCCHSGGPCVPRNMENPRFPFYPQLPLSLSTF